MNKKKKAVSYAKYGYIFSLPFIITFALFTLYPIIYTVIIGFTDLKGVGKTAFHFLTEDPFANFKAVLGAKTFWTALKNTFILWGVNFLPQILLALLLAALFTNTRNKVKGQGFFKVVFYMPNIITAATVSVLFASLFGYPMGPVNSLLRGIGILKEPFYFLNNKYAAKGIVSFIQFWMWYGYTMIILISGILGISPEIYESADIDGATDFQKFLYVTLPNLRTVLIYTLVTSLIGGLQMFDIPFLLVSKQGPNNATLTTSCFIYNQAFSGSYLYNKASAASIFMFILISIMSAFVFFLMRDKDEIAEKKLHKQVEKEMKAKMKAQKKGGMA
ncbi:MAG: sugar ABC transporter permease [Lachnospiraceae bacterium]|nr:sugar ABC transporter permease [Lachnospiraceae bacterium]